MSSNRITVTLDPHGEWTLEEGNTTASEFLRGLSIASMMNGKEEERLERSSDASDLSELTTFDVRYSTVLSLSSRLKKKRLQRCESLFEGYAKFMLQGSQPVQLGLCLMEAYHLDEPQSRFGMSGNTDTHRVALAPLQTVLIPSPVT